MEVRSLLDILLRKWWLAVPIVLIGFGAAMVITLSQPRVYESSTSVIVTPSGTFADDLLSAITTVSRQPEIAETYAQIANSNTIRVRAVEQLGLDARQREDVKLDSHLVPGTTILELSVRSTNPQLAQTYADTVRELLTEYTASLGGIFELKTLDVANATQNPVAPNVPLNAAVGLFASLVLGIGAAFASELLAPAPRVPAGEEMLDRESLAYSSAFFMLRMRQEMSRSRRSKTPLVVGLINVAHGSVFDSATARQRGQALRSLRGLLEIHLRPEDILARLDSNVFALLLPDTKEDEAVPMVEAIRRRVALPALGQLGGQAIHAQPAAGLASYVDESITPEELVERARSALRDAESIPVGKTQAFSTLQPRASD
jgi:diguanylate cyclase (GGDEF)-like protein